MSRHALVLFAVAVATIAGVRTAAGSVSAHAQATEIVALPAGCSNVAVTWPSAIPAQELAAAVSPVSALLAIRRLNNATQSFQGFSRQHQAASDLASLSPLDAVYLCMSGPGTLTRPTTGAPPPTASHGGPVRDYVSLVDNLRAAGATVEPVDEVSQPFLSASGFVIRVNGEDVQVFEYPNDAAADAAAAMVSPDGGTIGRTSVSWVAPPHFYRKGRIIVLYVGADRAITGLLESVLGPQFVGR